MFFEAQIVTQEINRGGGGLQGQVYMHRVNPGAENSDNRTALNYLPYDQFMTKIETTPNDVQEYFSITDNGKVVVAEIQSTTVSKVTDSEDELFDKKENSQTTYNITPREIDYKNLISQYTTPMTFFITLGVTTRNPLFLEAVAKLVKETAQIDLTVIDTTTTEVTTQVDKYTEHTLNSTVYYDIAGNVQSMENSKDVNVQETTTTTVTTIVPQLKVTYVNTWVCEQKITYKKLPSEQTSQNNTIEQPSDDPKTLNGNSNVSESVSWTTREPSSVNMTTSVEHYDNGTASDYVDKTDEFIKLLDVKYNIPNSKEKRKAGSYLISDAEILFALLQQNPETQGMEQIMRYIMYKYTGKNYGVTDLDFSMFDPAEGFSTTSNSGSLLDYLWQFSHNTKSAPQSADGKYYKMYGDGVRMANYRVS